MDPNATRRGMLGIATAAAMCAAVPAAAAAAARSPDGIRPEFLAAERLFRRLEARSDRYSTAVYEPARQRWLAAVAALPHTSVPFNTGDHATELTTADLVHVKLARTLAERPRYGDPQARKLLAAHLRRERAGERLPERGAQKAAYKRGEQLEDESSAAEDAFFAMPVTSLAELTHKLRVLPERKRDWEGCVDGIILPDVLALTTREARA